MTDVALIAGNDGVPAALAAELSAQGIAPLVCALADAPPVGLPVDLPFRFERLSPFLRALGDRGITQVVLVGAMQRPAMDPDLFDRETASLVPELLAAMKGGDDAALRWFIELIEDYDLSVRGIHDIAPGLLLSQGVLSQRPPTDEERADATRGRAILEALAPVDVGQGCVVASGLCLGIESIYGTDILLADVARHRARRVPHSGGMFVKRAKIGQDLRVDLPTVGPDTITEVCDAGLTGLCLHAGHVVILDRPAVLRAADAAGLTLWAEP